MGVSKSQMKSVDVLYMNTENRWLVNLARNQNSLVVVARLSFCKTADTPTTINEYQRFSPEGTSR